MMKIVRKGCKVWILMRFLKERRRLKRKKLKERKGTNCLVLSRQDNDTMVVMHFTVPSLFLVIIMIVMFAYRWQTIDVAAVLFSACADCLTYLFD